MKEIRLPYNEYKKMEEKINEQEVAIRALLKNENIVTLIYDYNSIYSNGIPTIIYNGSNEVIKKIQVDLEASKDTIVGLRIQNKELYTKNLELSRRRDKWW